MPGLTLPPLGEDGRGPLFLKNPGSETLRKNDKVQTRLWCRKKPMLVKNQVPYGPLPTSSASGGEAIRAQGQLIEND